MQKLNIVVVASTTREKRLSIKAAELVADVGKEFPEVEIILVDVKDFFPLPGEGNDPESQHPKWIAINQKSDAYFIVTPEYNHSFPGSLKMLLDNDLKNYIHKPVAMAGVSSSGTGGARAIESLLPPLRELGLVATFTDVLFFQIGTFLEQAASDPEVLEQQKERIRKAYKELIWMAKSLKWGRENL